MRRSSSLAARGAVAGLTTLASTRRAAALTAATSRVVAAAMTWLLVVGLARLLGNAAFGDYIGLMAIIQVVGVVADAGLNRVLVRDVAVDPTLSAGYARTVRRARFALSMAAVVLAFGIAGVAGSFGGLPLAVGAIGLVPLADARTSEALLYASGRIPRAAFLAAAYATTRLVLSMAAAAVGGVAAVMAAHSVAAALYAIAIRKALAGPDSGGHTLSMADLFRVSYPFAGLIALEALYARLDVFIIAIITGQPAQVGLYGAAYKLFEAAMIPSSAIAAVLVPEYARRLARNDPTLPSALARAVTGSMLVGVAGAVVVVPLAKPIMALAYGESFVSASGAVEWLAIAAIAALGVYPLSALLAASRLQRSVLVWSVVQVAVNAVANVTLVALFGITGAAAAMALTTFTGVSIYGSLVARSITRSPRAPA